MMLLDSMCKFNFTDESGETEAKPVLSEEQTGAETKETTPVPEQPVTKQE